MELRLWTAIGLLLVITVGAVVGITVIALVLPGGSGGAPPAPDSGSVADAPSIDAPGTDLLTGLFLYGVAFGLGGFVGLFIGVFVGQKAARSQSRESITDGYDRTAGDYTDGGDPSEQPPGEPAGSESDDSRQGTGPQR